MIRGLAYGLAFAIVALATLWVTADSFRATQERQTTYKYFSQAFEPAPERQNRIEWGTPVRELDRPFTKADAELIGRALDEAWRLHAAAQEAQNPDVLARRFTGVALARATTSVSDAAAHGGRMVVLEQRARPAFFHKDGSLFQAEVEMTVSRFLPSKDGGYFALSRDTGVATFMNESNGWRLFSYELRQSERLQGASGQWSGRLKGINYYPGATPWREFWGAFDGAVVEKDFAAIRSLGANSVRIFITRDDFVGPDPDAALADLALLLDLAERHELAVVPTLFDLKQSFGLATWSDDAVYLRRVLPVLAGSEAVAFVDIKNEPDLDFQAHGSAKITAWLRTMIGLTRRQAPGLALSVGWSKAEFATTLGEEVDVITYHDYAPLEGTQTRLAEVVAQAGDKAVLVTEIGTSSFELALGFPGFEANQSEVLRTRLAALEQADGVMIWTLHDFERVDPSVVGGSPWVGALQKRFGLLREDGSEKPAAMTVRESWATGGN